MTIALFGGAFDPPHRGHVGLAQQAKLELGVPKLLVLVSADPGHKHVATPADDRLHLARAAFPDDEVQLDEHPRTVDLLRAHPEWDDPVLVLGADQFVAFPDWREPEEVLRRARLAVGTRPGFSQTRLDDVLGRLDQPERVRFFELAEPVPSASRDLRERLERGEDVDAELPPAVAAVIRADGLYRGGHGYTAGA
jgi:nicotinate-nucleotide adenylyltransferase